MSAKSAMVKQMIKKWCIIAILLLSLSAISVCYAIDEAKSKEYQIKAAFLYNFIKFVDWPANIADSNEIIIGVISKEPLVNLFEPLKDKKVKNKNVIIRQYPSFDEIQKLGTQNKTAMNEQIESIKKCHLLFICASEADNLSKILDEIKDKNILTVGEMEDFLTYGGIINFVVDEKVRFEINLESSDKAKLKISSQLLQLAKKVTKAKEHT